MAGNKCTGIEMKWETVTSQWLMQAGRRLQEKVETKRGCRHVGETTSLSFEANALEPTKEKVFQE